MIAELERARGLSFNEPRLRRRHALMVIAISVVHTTISAFFLYDGYFAGGLAVFMPLFVLIWAGNLGYLALVLSGATRRWREPTLAVPVTLWLTTSFLVTSYYIDAFRISVLMLFFGATLLASFRVNFVRVALLSVYASLGYAVVLVMAFSDHGIALSLSVEALQWLIFSLSCIGFAVTGTGIHVLRSRLSDKNEELHIALGRVRDMAIQDDLTGLFNRRHIFEALQQQKAIAESGGYSFCICYLDLDHFKAINDTYGHGVGDRVLQRFAGMLQELLRDADYCGRLGGEEFVLILCNARLETAWQVCERLRTRLQTTSFRDLAASLTVTVSTGIAEFVPGDSIDDTMGRADSCLYQAKSEGRNRVIADGLEKKYIGVI